MIQEHYGIHVLRDDLMGGTKMVCMPFIQENDYEYVYASSVYGGFQISLSLYFGKSLTIFCAKRNVMHPNTLRCKELGANIIEVPFGYLSVIEKKAREYSQKPNCKKIIFGGKDYIDAIEKYAASLKLKGIDEIWCAVGSGTLVSAICRAYPNIKVYGVTVGGKVKIDYPNLTLLEYHKPFSYESKLQLDFPSMPNYDRKAFEVCLLKSDGNVLFWNVL